MPRCGRERILLPKRRACWNFSPLRIGVKCGDGGWRLCILQLRDYQMGIGFDTERAQQAITVDNNNEKSDAA